MSKYSVKKPYTVLVAVVLVLVLGFVSFTKMTTDLLPSINLPYLMVVTTYPGASPEKVESSVTAPLESALGTVTGVEPQFFIQQELQHDGLTELIVTRDMAERKTKMIELGDAFIAFPGGTGTLEEIAEVMSRVSLGQLDAPCILYDLNGYYDSLKALLDKMIEKGLSTPQRQRGIRFAANLEEITTILNKA